MKLLLAVLSALCLVSANVMALEPNTANKSSFTITSHNGYISAAYLDKVIVAMTSSGGVLRLFNSTWTTSVQISSISLGTIATHDFSNMQVQGLFLSINNNANGVTILYK